MKFKSSYILLILVLILGSCKSKKTVTQKREPQKTVTKKIEPVKKAEAEIRIPSTTEAYIEMYKGIAMDEMRAHKIPASVTLAQGILESSSGKSPLALRSNNHFGIKCHKSWTGKRTTHDDDKKNECFRVYDDPRISYKDHSQFLMTRSWYDGLFKLKEDDYVAWAKGLKAAGYATDKRYPSKLIDLIEKYGLYRYDVEVLGISSRKSKKADKRAKEIKKEVSNKKSTTNTVNKSNKGKHVVVKGDTLYSISKRYGTSVTNLKRLNNLNSNTISIGQVLRF